MLRKIKLKNSTILLLGITLIFAGVITGALEYFKEKKDNAFSKMNILLYESEIPKEVESDDDLDKNKNDSNEPSNSSEPSKEPSPSENKPQYNYNYTGILEIPKINLKRGFLDINSKYNNVDYNVTVINGSTMPDTTNNNLILASHSGNCSVCYFHNLYKINTGDVAYVYYKGIKYGYTVTNIYEVEKTGTVAIYRDHNKKVLTLITCTRNSNTKQTVYILELSSEGSY